MLKTIRAHKNLHYLTDRLPKSNYNNGHEYEKVPKMSQSTKAKNPSQPSNMHPSRLINLPKLDRIIVRNNNGYKSPSGAYHGSHAHDRKHIDVSNLLKI